MGTSTLYPIIADDLIMSSLFLNGYSLREFITKQAMDWLMERRWLMNIIIIGLGIGVILLYLTGCVPDTAAEELSWCMRYKPQFNWSDGNVDAYAIRISPGAENYRFILYCDRLNMAKVLEQFVAWWVLLWSLVLFYKLPYSKMASPPACSLCMASCTALPHMPW